MLCKFQMVIHLHAYYLHHTANINQNLAVGQCSPAVITGICCETKPVLGYGTVSPAVITGICCKLNQYLAVGQFLQQLLQDTAVELNQYLAAGQFLQQLLQDTAVVVDISGICTVTLTVEVEGR